MKHRLSIMIALAIVLTFAFTTVSWAKGVDISAPIEQMTVKMDKNQKEYVRFIVPVPGTTDSGVAYTKSVPFMAFGALAQAAKLYKEGDILTCVAEMRIYNGRESYTILKFVK